MADFTKKYPVYKDLEPFHEYKSSCIIDIHADILKLVNYLYTHYTGKEQNIHGYNTSAKVGSSINSFMQTLEYENTLLREQISLYVNYILFFHSSHTGYLTKLSLKIQKFQKEIEEEIMINHRGGGGDGGGGDGGGGDGGGGAYIPELDDFQDLTSSEIGAFLSLSEDEPTEIERLLRESEVAIKSGEIVIQEFETTQEEHHSATCVDSQEEYIADENDPPASDDIPPQGTD
jgi:hypothetical protein